jgi:HAD superfamily hydrolase (TIGR01509 family)
VSNLIIFDFDGVVADSEGHANSVLAEIITELGVPMTLEDAYLQFMGKPFPDVISRVKEIVGENRPEDFAQYFQDRLLSRFRRDLQPVPGVNDYIAAFNHLPMCIASNSSHDRLKVCLEVLRLQKIFGKNVFSASDVVKAKPHPDLFLHAAKQMDTDPSRTIVIEDSASGVTAAVAAGMKVIGLLAGSHIQSRHEQELLVAGANYVVNTFAEAKDYTNEIQASWV